VFEESLKKVRKKVRKKLEKKVQKKFKKKGQKKCCNYLLGIIYKLLERSRGDGKEVVRKKIEKKV
jgi:hypothetical protein